MLHCSSSYSPLSQPHSIEPRNCYPYLSAFRSTYVRGALVASRSFGEVAVHACPPKPTPPKAVLEVGGRFKQIFIITIARRGSLLGWQTSRPKAPCQNFAIELLGRLPGIATTFTEVEVLRLLFNEILVSWERPKSSWCIFLSSGALWASQGDM